MRVSELDDVERALLPGRRAAMCVVCWRDKKTGGSGKGVNPVPRPRGEKLAANLNRNFPGFEHWLEPAESDKEP